MLLPALIALLAAETPATPTIPATPDTSEIRCPVRLTVTGMVRGDSGVTVVFFDTHQDPFYINTKKLPFDTTISITPWPNMGAGWSAKRGSHMGIILAVTSRKGSRAASCERSEEICEGAWRQISLTKDCQVE